MKKLLGISVIAMLAVAPAFAEIAVVQPAEHTGTAGAATATTNPEFALATAGTNDDKAASAGYVKGAYNAAIRAINKVNAKTTVEGGNGISKSENTVSVDLTDKGGLQMNGNTDGSKTVGVKTGDGITLNGTSGAVEVNMTSNGGLETTGTAGQKTVGVKVGDAIKVGSAGVEVDFTSNGGLKLDGSTAGSKTLAVNTGDGLQKDATDGTITVKAEADKGIAVSSSGVAVDAGNGISLDSNGVNVQAKTNGGIAVDSSGVAVDYKTAGGLVIDTTGTDAGKLKVVVDDSTIAVDGTSGAIKIKEGVQGTNTTGYTDSKALTTKGYVDESIDGLATDYAKKANVVQTIKATQLNSAVGEFTLASGTVGGTASVPIMDTWGSDTPASTELAVTNNLTVGTAINEGTVTTTILPASVTYNTVDCNDAGNANNVACKTVNPS